MQEELLIAREVEEDPYKPGPGNVRLRRTGVPVWAIIGHYLYAVREDTSAVGRDYDLSPDEVRAALAHYGRHKAEIDGRLAENRVVFTE